MVTLKKLSNGLLLSTMLLAFTACKKLTLSPTKITGTSSSQTVTPSTAQDTLAVGVQSIFVGAAGTYSGETTGIFQLTTLGIDSAGNLSPFAGPMGPIGAGAKDGFPDMVTIQRDKNVVPTLTSGNANYLYLYYRDSTVNKIHVLVARQDGKNFLQTIIADPETGKRDTLYKRAVIFTGDSQTIIKLLTTQNGQTTLTDNAEAKLPAFISTCFQLRTGGKIWTPAPQ